jgi:formate dehydrogenase iron-sulfur subunit
MKEYAILLDTTLCTGCNTCMYKCVQENRLQNPGSRGMFRTTVYINDEGPYHHRCMHCLEPACVGVCPTGALTQSEYGPVLYNPALCTGEKECVDACPFHVPIFDELTQNIVKCTMCAHRIKEGREPACVEVCPTSALQFGEYNELVARAKELAAKTKLHIYGLEEAGGTHTIILAKEDPVTYGFPAVERVAQRPKGSKIAKGSVVPPLAAVAVVGLKRYSERRDEVAAQTKEECLTK